MSRLLVFVERWLPVRLFWKIIPWSGTAKKKKIWFPGHDNLRSRATPPPPLLHATNTHILMHTCWPVLLRRREMLSNSAFQHSTSDYLFSFTGRFELVMYFPFGVGLASLSRTFSLTHTGNSSFPSGRRSRNLRGQAFFFLFPPYE